MAEYIEREAAIEAVKKERDYTGKFTFEEEHAWAVGFQQGITFALSDIAVIPAADVRPVVLCRDCTFFKPQQKSARWSSTTPMCSRSATIKMPPDGFCSFGVKREES